MRLDKNLTQDELAARIHTTKQTIHKYENGIITNIPSSKIEAIANALNTTPDYLMGSDIKNPPDQQSPEEIAKVALFGGDGEVTDEMWNEVKGFVEFIKDKRKRENDNN